MDKYNTAPYGSAGAHSSLCTKCLVKVSTTQSKKQICLNDGGECSYTKHPESEDPLTMGGRCGPKGMSGGRMPGGQNPGRGGRSGGIDCSDGCCGQFDIRTPS